MHYYQFNIADYRKSTQYLSFLEHAIYRSLLDSYYLDESPLCGDLAKLMRLHGVRTNDEKEAFNLVIEDFFVLKDGLFHHEKCDQVLAKIYEKSEKARASAMKRWERNANASETQCEGNANGMLPNTQYPNTQIPKEPPTSAKPKYSNEDYEFAKKAFEEILKHSPDHKKPNLESWAKDVRLMREIDKRSFDDMAEVWVWCHKDSFEQANVQSISKFRKRYDQLKLKANGKPPESGYKSAQQQRADSAALTFDPDHNLRQLEGL